MPSLVVPLEAYKFGLKDEEGLRRQLERADRNSTFVPLSSAADLLMDKDGFIGPSRLRFTASSLRQVCGLLASGLLPLVDRLSVERPDLFHICVSVYNQLLSSLFRDRLFGKQLLIDTEAGRIDAVVGDRFRSFANVRAHQCFEEAAAGKLVHYEAAIAGRAVLLRRYDPDVLFVHEGKNYHRGAHVYSREDGRSALHASASFLAASGPMTFLESSPRSRSRRAVFTHNRFDARVSQLLEAACSGPVDAAQFRRSIQEAGLKCLGLDRRKPEVEQARRSLIARQLHTLRFRGASASRVLGQLLLRNDNLKTTVNYEGVTDEELASRSLLDLAFAICRVGKGLSVENRERADAVAYKILQRVSKF